MTQSEVGRQLHLSQSTVQTIWSNKKYILLRASNPRKKWKNLHWKRYSQIEEAMSSWLKECRTSGIQVEDDKMLLDKANEYADHYKQRTDFKSQAERWVEMFKKRYGIVLSGDKDKKPTRLHNHHGSSNHQHQSVISQQQSPLLPPPHGSSQLSHLLSNHHHHQSLSMNVVQIPTANNNQEDLVSNNDFVDFSSSSTSSLPSLMMQGLYAPPQPISATVTDSNTPSMTPTLLLNGSRGGTFNNNSHLPLPPVASSAMPAVTTCDAMKYVELLRSWVQNTFPVSEPSSSSPSTSSTSGSNYNTNNNAAEVLSNHLNAIENLILKKRMNEMVATNNMVNGSSSNNYNHR
jgi:hypothetical protein